MNSRKHVGERGWEALQSEQRWSDGKADNGYEVEDAMKLRVDGAHTASKQD
ncbi:MAG: hypothetical protein ABI601_07075 [bacterium]